MTPRRLRGPVSRAAVAGVVASALVGLSSAALAAPTEADRAAAEALFKTARQLVGDGDYAAGCPKFEASFALFPSASTLLNIAKCHEHEGKLATAWKDYSQALALNRDTRGAERQQQLAAIAEEGMRALEPRLPRLRIVVTGAPPDVRVLRDKVQIPAPALGEALPVDPGQHEIRVSAPGRVTETRTVTLEEGKTVTVEIALKEAPKASPAAAEGGVPTWVWVTGGAGLALTGASVYFLIDDLAAIDALRENCPTQGGVTTCAPGYDYESDNARKNRSLALFLGLGGAGAVALGAAVVGLVTAPSSPAPASQTGLRVRASPWVGPSGGGAAISGVF